MTYENNAFEMGLERLVDFGAGRRRLDLDRRPAPDQGRGRRAADRRRRARRRAVPGPEQHQVAARSTATSRRSARSPRPSTRRGSEANIGYCWVPTALADGGHGARGGHRVGRPQRDRRPDAVRRPREADPRLVSALVQRVAAPTPPRATLYFGPWYRKSPFFERDARGRLQRLRHLQPHVPAGLLRRPGRGVLGAAQRRDAVGRRRRADRRDHRAGRRRRSRTRSPAAT